MVMICRQPVWNIARPEGYSTVSGFGKEALVTVRQGFLFLMAGSLVLAATSSCGGTPKRPGDDRPAAVETPATYVMNAVEIKLEYLPLDIPTSMKAGAVVTARFQVKNLSRDSWLAKGSSPVKFGYHWSDPVGTGSWSSVVWDDGQRASLPSDVPPGGKAVLVLSVQALPKPTREAKLIIAPVMDGQPGGWQQEAPLVVTVNIE
jgi:hypothetical protein